MGLLSKLRAWIGGDEADDRPADAETAGEDATAADPDDDPDEQSGLDPSAANETRTAATDDAVDALRDVRRSQGGSPVEEGADEAAGDAGGDERDAP
jgi:DNA-directed RNA polymerase delta subunit